MSRTEGTTKTTRVRHIAKPLGDARENGPHLSDLRRFVAECVGLPDEVLVRISAGHLSESGRRDVTLEAVWSRPADEDGAS